MEVAHRADSEQTALWNGTSGNAWAQLQEPLDALFRPLETLLAEAIPAGSEICVLDVGCGAGSTTLAAARRLADSGRAVGIDISEPLIGAARRRAEQDHVAATFIHGDAQKHVFEPGAFEMIISRFGVMFFDDPVEAFANLRKATSDNGQLRFIAWRSPSENPFMTTAERAARPLVPDLPVPPADAPGQFAFADQRRIHTILDESGWSEIDIRPIDVSCAMPEEHLIPYITLMGPVGRILQGSDARTRKEVLAAMRPAFDHYVRDAEVRFTASCWMVEAQR